MLLRQVLGDTLRGHRLGQRRTLREVSSAARVSLGYLSEVERGQKEASSELLAAISTALGLRLSELLREVGDTFVLVETGALHAAEDRPALEPVRMSSDVAAAPVARLRTRADDGGVVAAA